MTSVNATNVTRDGIEVKIGQRWEDQDKRMRRRIIEVRAVIGGYAFFGPSLKRRIAIRRMYKHSTGFVLVPDDPREPRQEKEST